MQLTSGRRHYAATEILSSTDPSYATNTSRTPSHHRTTTYTAPPTSLSLTPAHFPPGILPLLLTTRRRFVHKPVTYLVTQKNAASVKPSLKNGDNWENRPKPRLCVLSICRLAFHHTIGSRPFPPTLHLCLSLLWTRGSSTCTTLHRRPSSFYDKTGCTLFSLCPRCK